MTHTAKALLSGRFAEANARLQAFDPVELGPLDYDMPS
jgi:hypothetical protein